jgi:hypothetical protein
MSLKQLIEINPRKLFLLDGAGAILSAFLLGVVLVKLERFFGIPADTLYLLAILPVFFAIYDFCCYRNGLDKVGQFLRGIAILNVLYCVLSIVCAFYHIETITSLGWAYIIIEILIVLILVILELKAANKWINAQDKRNETQGEI